MNFIILNGRKSTEVAGLMIQSLPPVVKPPMRVQLDEVDGRDGDIITPLGYSGYDRTVKIGLRGVYDEDDIVEYFNSSGKVIFSNEPDKVYDYTIVESFSLDRLRKFREAEVVFHVQPFKHSVVEEKTVSAITIRNCATPKIPFNAWVGVGTDLQYSNGNLTLTSNLWASAYVLGYAGYEIDENRIIKPGSYDVYLTIGGGEIQYGWIKVGITDKTNQESGSRKEYIADGQIDSSSSGTLHFMLDVDAEFTMKHIRFELWPAENIIEGYYRFRCTDFTISNLRIMASTGAELLVINRGNTIAAPRFALTEARNCTLKVNDGNPVIVSASELENFVIDTEQMNAYSGNELKNRLCTGNYANLLLKPGKNEVVVDGVVASVEVSDYSRWI